MKQYTLPALTIISILALSGCTSSAASKTVLDNQAISSTPQWSKGEIALGSWGETKKAQKPTDKTDVAGIVESPLAPAIFTYNNISYSDESTGCKITGLVTYLESYKQPRGDDYNSKDYLYSQVPQSEKPVSNETIQTINGTDYIVGEYTQPEEWGANRYHKTAVRVFSKALDIENYVKPDNNTEPAYSSDLSKGLPVATIDYSCSSPKALTEKQWNDGIKHFKLLLSKEEIKNDKPKAAKEDPNSSTHTVVPSADPTAPKADENTLGEVDETITPPTGDPASQLPSGSSSTPTP